MAKNIHRQFSYYPSLPYSPSSICRLISLLTLSVNTINQNSHRRDLSTYCYIHWYDLKQYGLSCSKSAWRSNKFLSFSFSIPVSLKIVTVNYRRHPTIAYILRNDITHPLTPPPPFNVSTKLQHSLIHLTSVCWHLQISYCSDLNIITEALCSASIAGSTNNGDFLPNTPYPHSNVAYR